MSESDRASSRKLNATVSLEGTVKFLVDRCNHKFYQKLVEFSARYPDIVTIDASSIGGRPTIYEEIGVIITGTDDYSGRHLECLRDITKIIDGLN